MFVILSRFYLRFFSFLYFSLSLSNWILSFSIRKVCENKINHSHGIPNNDIPNNSIPNQKGKDFEQMNNLRTMFRTQCSVFNFCSEQLERKLNNIEISVFMFMCSEHAQKKRVHVHVFRGSKMRCSLFICSFCSTFVQCSCYRTRVGYKYVCRVLCTKSEWRTKSKRIGYSLSRWLA